MTISNVAAQSYAASRPVTAPQPGSASRAIGAATDSFIETLRSSEHAAINTMTGKQDPHGLVEALAQSELAVETAVTIRDKVVAAYQEILRMPV